MNLETKKLAATINVSQNIMKIGLQFTLSLQNFFQIEFITLIKELCPSKSFFIIGDTSYSNCCCDEITATHLNADIIVRIGSSCFTLNHNIPSYFLYDNLTITNDQLNACYISLNKILTKEKNYLFHIIIFYSEIVQKYLIDILRKETKYEGLHFADIKPYLDNNSMDLPDLYGRFIHNFIFDKEAIIIYIGNETDKLLNELCLRFISRIKSIYLINIVNYQHCLLNQSIINPCLYRRFNLIEKAKQAKTFGILIGSLSIHNLSDSILKIKHILQLNNKKCYTFLLGKLTEEKLCNFSEYIDCFVLIACPFNPAFHTKISMKPIVSSLDIKIAFDTAFSWDSSYSFDVYYFKHNNNDMVSQTSNSNINNKIEKTTCEALETKSENEELIPIFSQMTLTTYDERKFKGLSVEGEKTIKAITKGKRGIPIKYEELK